VADFRRNLDIGDPLETGMEKGGTILPIAFLISLDFGDFLLGNGVVVNGGDLPRVQGAPIEAEVVEPAGEHGLAASDGASEKEGWGLIDERAGRA
jgi:hypothetical protein